MDLLGERVTYKAKPMTKTALSVLLQLIDRRPIITSPSTNARINRLKDEAWREVASDFREMVGESRRPEQLRLKWENIKKSARKRAAAIRHIQNNLIKNRGKEYIPPDEILDRVVSMLVNRPGSHSRVREQTPRAEPDDNLDNSVRSHEEQNKEAEDTPTNINKDAEDTPILYEISDEYLKAQIERENAMASYFRAKEEKTKYETEKLKLEIERMKNNL